MRSILLIISLIIFTTCSDKSKSQNEYYPDELLSMLNKQNLGYFKNLYPDKFVQIKEHQAIIKIDSIVTQSRIENFDYTIAEMNKVAKSYVDGAFLISYEGIEKSINVIDFHQYILSNKIIEYYNNFRACFDRFNPIVVPEINNSNDSNYYQAKIYLAVSDSHQDFMVVVDGDTLENNDNVPQFRKRILEKRGFNENAIFIWKWKGEPTVFDFEIEYK